MARLHRQGCPSFEGADCQAPVKCRKGCRHQSCLDSVLIEVVLDLRHGPGLDHRRVHLRHVQRQGLGWLRHQRQHHWSCCEQARCVLDQKLDQGSAKRPFDCQCSAQMFVELMLSVALDE